MLNINIESIYSISEKLLENNKSLGNACISITSTDTKTPEFNNFKHLLILKFDDIIEKRENCEVLFSRKHLNKIVKFYKNIKKQNIEKVTIHCHAGVHRSTAAGLMLLYLEYNDYKIAEEKLIKARAIPLPNRLMIEMFDKKFNTSLISVVDSLEDRFKKFVNDEISIDLDDYLEVLEEV